MRGLQYAGAACSIAERAGEKRRPRSSYANGLTPLALPDIHKYSNQRARAKHARLLPAQVSLAAVPQNATGTFVCEAAMQQNGTPVYKYVLDPFGKTVRLLVGRGIADRIRIEDRDVGEFADTNRAAIA